MTEKIISLRISISPKKKALEEAYCRNLPTIHQMEMNLKIKRGISGLKIVDLKLIGPQDFILMKEMFRTKGKTNEGYGEEKR